MITVDYSKDNLKDDLKKAIEIYGEMTAFYEKASNNPFIIPESMEELLEDNKVQLQIIHKMIDSL